jgi:hypothetical protein
LIHDFRFKNALLKLDEENIPLLADEIIKGNAKTAAESRWLREYYEKFGKHHDYLNPPKPLD